MTAPEEPNRIYGDPVRMDLFVGGRDVTYFRGLDDAGDLSCYTLKRPEES